MFGTVSCGGRPVRAYRASHCGLMMASGACRAIVRRSVRSGIWGLPQSRECENVQSAVRIRPAAPAALARSSRAAIWSRVPHQ